MKDEIKTKIIDIYNELEPDFKGKSGHVKAVVEKINSEFGAKVVTLNEVTNTIGISKITDEKELKNISLIEKACIIVTKNDYQKTKEIFDKQDVLDNNYFSQFISLDKEVNDSIKTYSPDKIIKFLQDFKNKEIGCRSNTKVEFETDEYDNEQKITVYFKKYKILAPEHLERYAELSANSKISEYLFYKGTNGVREKSAKEIVDWAKRIVNKYKNSDDNSALASLVKNYDDSQSKESKQEKNNFDILKEKINSNDYLIIFKQKKNDNWDICYRPNDITYRNDFDYKAIHIKDESVLKEAFKNGNKNDFINNYDENCSYDNPQKEENYSINKKNKAR